MAVQSPPFALQNGSHSAQVFRQAAYSPFANPGVLAPGDFAVTAQGTPNMSVQVAAGRAWLPGTQVANVSGGSFSTQAAYFAINDGPVTVTISTANATNPRIDTVYAAVQDAFYSGTTNVTVLGVVTGTPAASPFAPAAPSNCIALASVAVAANATSITNSNITVQPVTTLLASTLSGIDPVSSTNVTAGTYIDQYRGHTINGLERWDGSKWSTPTPAVQWVSQLNNTSYAYSCPTAAGTAITSGSFSVTVPAGRQLEVEFAAPDVVLGSASNGFVLMNLNGATVDGNYWGVASNNSVANPSRVRGTWTNTGTSPASCPVSVQAWSLAGGMTINAVNGIPVTIRYRFL